MTVRDDDLTNVLLEAPLTVRVEIASMALSVREWSVLREGDVIDTGVRLREPVVLRVAGREIATGELVNIEGTVGVRLNRILEPQ